jgi:hypothetical protein
MDVPSSGKRIYRNPLQDYLDQVLFFGFFLIGSAAIWSLKVWGLDQVVVTIVPVALMVLYAVIALITKRYRIREDRVGDNVYYLGFLFTLVSLAYALRVYNPEGSGAADIITNFGIAISTTIIGLAGRVLFNQMREDPEEYEREARISLAEAASALHDELYNITSDLKSFKTSMVQITKEGVEEVANAAKEGMEQSVEQFSAVAKTMIESIEAAFGSFNSQATVLNELASKNAMALEALFHKIEAIEASPDMLSGKFALILAKFDEVADEAVKRNRNQTNDLKRFKDIIEAATAASEALNKTLGGADVALTKYLTTFMMDLEKTSSLALRFSETLDQSATHLKQQLEASQKLSNEIAEGAGAQKQAIIEVRKSIESELAQIEQHRGELAKIATESRDAVILIEKSLVSLSTTMVETLSGQRAA